MAGGKEKTGIKTKRINTGCRDRGKEENSVGREEV